MKPLVDTAIHWTDSRTHTARADGYVEDPKKRRFEERSLTLRAAGPRAARLNETLIPKHKHHLIFKMFVFLGQGLVLTPAVGKPKAGVLQPVCRRGAWWDPRAAPGGAASKVRCGYLAPFPSDLRFFDSST